MNFKIKLLISLIIFPALLQITSATTNTGATLANTGATLNNTCGTYSSSGSGSEYTPISKGDTYPFVTTNKVYEDEHGNKGIVYPDNILDLVKENYTKNQNSIYNCAILKIQIESIEQVINKLSKIGKNPDLISIIKNKFNFQKIKIQSNQVIF
jgi:CRISPR/Cas system-associated endoribonuclease Cas2